jgi:hypothetical protein
LDSIFELQQKWNEKIGSYFSFALVQLVGRGSVQPQLATPKKPLVFPNPGSSEVHIQYPYPGNWQTRVFDAQGKPTETKGRGEELSVLQTRQLPAGLYYIRIWDGKSSFLVPWMKQ